MDSTYTEGLTFKCTKDITKNDIVLLCDLLTERYNGLCTFQPEGIAEGGIKFVFNADYARNWYKSVRLHVTGAFQYATANGRWYWIDDNCMMEWKNSDDLIFREKNIRGQQTRFSTFLKSFYGAPVFTIQELEIWEDCFSQIGIRKVGKYPAKKSLICNTVL
jgi:hypothetical protein